MGLREFRVFLTKAIRRVRGGETIEITRDGEPAARLTLIRGTALEGLIAEGRVSPPLGPIVLPIPRPARGLLSASEALQEDRCD